MEGVHEVVDPKGMGGKDKDVTINVKASLLCESLYNSKVGSDSILGNSVNGGSNPVSFASIFKDTTSKKTVRISLLFKTMLKTLGRSMDLNGLC